MSVRTKLSELIWSVYSVLSFPINVLEYLLLAEIRLDDISVISLSFEEISEQRFPIESIVKELTELISIESLSESVLISPLKFVLN